MTTALEDFFWRNFIEQHFLFGDRWILLLPFLLTTGYFWFIKKYKELSFRNTIKDKLFWIPSLGVFVLCITLYLTFGFLLPPKDRFVVAIAEFLPVSKDEIGQSKKMKDRLIHEIKEREHQYNIKMSIKSLSETIDCSNEKGLALARKLGHRNKVHIVVCGKMRLDEEYFFEPVIVNLKDDLYPIAGKDNIVPLVIGPAVLEIKRVELKKQKINEIADLLSAVYGFALYESKQYQESINVFSSIRYPSTEIFFLKGNASYFLDNLDDAVAYFNRAIELNPNFFEGWINEGVALTYLRKFDESLEAFNRAIQIRPNSAVAWMNKGVSLTNIPNFDQAVRALDKAIQLEPNSPWAWVNMGNALIGLQKFDEGIKAYDKAIKIASNYDFVESIKPWQGFADMTAHDEIKTHVIAISWYNKGNVFAHKRIYDKAIEAYDKAIEIKPDFAYAWSNKGLALGHLGRKDEALRAHDNATRINPKDAAGWFNKGNSFAELGRPYDAMDAFNMATRIKPDFSDAWNNKGLLLFFLGRQEEALQAIDKAISTNHLSASAWNNKGVVLQHAKRFDEAISAYNMATEIRHDSASSFYNLARIYSLNKDKNKALKNLSRATKLDRELIEEAKKEEDFKLLWNEKEFKKLIR